MAISIRYNLDIPHVIGIAGQKRNGKDTVAEMLMEKLSLHRRVAFADNVKATLAVMTNFTHDTIERHKVLTSKFDKWNMTVREALCLIGEMGRQINPGLWIDAALCNREDEYLIVTDCRYKNELDTIKRTYAGFNILVVRPSAVNDDPHPSESTLKPMAEYCLRYTATITGAIDITLELPAIDYVIINNGSLEQLKERVNELVSYLENTYKENQQ